MTSPFRSECDARANDVTRSSDRPTLRMLALDCGRLFELPKVPQNYCLIHNGGVECTCTEQHTHHERTCRRNPKPNCTQVLQVLGHETEREKCRTRLVESVIDRHKVGASLQQPQQGEKDKIREKQANKGQGSEKGRPSEKTKRDRLRPTNSGYVRTWLAAGAEVPRFIKEPFLARK